MGRHLPGATRQKVEMRQAIQDVERRLTLRNGKKHRLLAVLLASVATVAAALGVTSATARTASRTTAVQQWHVGEPAVLTLTPQRLSSDISFRETFGFQADVAYVKALYSLMNAGKLPGATRTWGALLTAAESANMMRRQALREFVGSLPVGAANNPTAISRYVNQNLQHFAGAYYDQLAGGTLTILMTADAAGVERQIRSLAGSFADMITVKQATYTLAQLDDLTQRIANDVPWLRSQGVSLASFGPDVQSNTVVLRVTGNIDSAVALVAKRYPSLPITVAIGAPAITTGTTSTEAPPMMGGLFMWRCDSDACYSATGCTSGFVIVSGSGQYGVVTAGHCGNGGGSLWVQGPFFSGQYIVGQTSTSVFGSSGDAEIIPLWIQSDYSHYIYISTTSCGFLCTSHNLRIAHGEEGAPTVGEVTCASRSQEGDETCGTITAINQCVYYSAENVTVCNQSLASFTDIPGDSGGPYYQPQTSGTSLAQGVASGTSSTNSNFSQINAGVFQALSSAGAGYWAVY